MQAASSIEPEINKKNSRVSHGRFAECAVKYRIDETCAQTREKACALAAELGISLVTASLLVARGAGTAELARSFLMPTLRNDIPDPTQIKNVVQAADLILDSIENKSRITVFHDFDVDGLTAGAQLSEFLLALRANVHCYVPNRFIEGYGLTFSALEKIIEAGTDLLITVDCGIASVKEIAYARKRGLKTIIVDHHEPAALPDADVIVDPAQEGCPFQEYRLAAAGLVWMLLIVLRTRARERFAAEIEGNEIVLPETKHFLDLAAIGTICDMVPLTAINRVIAHRGIEALRNTPRVGLVALMEVAGVANLPRFGCGHISFGLGPRINAAGRLDDASQVGLLLSTTDSIKAKRLAEAIDRINTRRRTVEEQVRLRCMELLLQDTVQLEAPAFAVYQEDFHLGVLGIAAQRLVEEFHKPAAVMGIGEAEIGGKAVPVVKGSVRGIEGFHVAHVLHRLASLLISGGGHAQAGGFSVTLEHLEEFRKGFVDAARQCLTPEMLQRTQKADLKVKLIDLDFKLVDELQRLAPFGVGNPSPVLVSENLYIESAAALSGKHLRLRVTDGTCSRNVIAWNFLGHPLLRKSNKVTMAYQAELNSYQGVSMVQLNLRQVWPAQT